MLWFLLGLLGVFVGAFGTLIGSAGGFLLVPVLLFLYPHESPATITSITLSVAFFNALSGSVAYRRLRRIDYRSGALFLVGSVPGAIAGAGVTNLLSRGLFQLLFGVVLLVTAGYLMIRPRRTVPAGAGKGHWVRQITDSRGDVSTYSYSRFWGTAIAFGAGFVSGMLGIGGGILHVPALTQLLSFPTHIATATSSFVVAITTLSALVTHVVTGVFTEGVRRAAVLAAGAIIGAQLGARLSQRISGVLVVRLLAAGMAIVALRLFIAPF
ncbi:MAG: sulfite exporter TauE/SafE family protein [Chloroflexi bacterium]|nr:sulfite exporter TauE/SafE family protein [Chloroflexota bacterium]